MTGPLRTCFGGSAFKNFEQFTIRGVAMQNISSVWLYLVILIAGALQAWAPPMNGALRHALANPWLASLVSFLPVIALLACIFFCLPQPLPTAEGVGKMPWWAPRGGVIGAFAWSPD
jgi:transporter family-2 protein